MTGEISGNLPHFTPEQLAAFAASADTLAIMERLLQPEEEDSLASILNMDTFAADIPENGGIKRVFAAGESSPDNAMESLGVYRNTLPSEYRNLSASYAGVVTVYHSAAYLVEEVYTIYRVYPDTDAAAALILRQYKKLTTFPAFKLNRYVKEALSARIESSDMSKDEKLEKLQAVENQDEVIPEGMVGVGSELILDAEEAKGLGKLLLYASRYATEQ